MSLFTQRKSCRQYNNQSISDEAIHKILQAGHVAPSGGNSKSAKFVVIQNNEVLTRLDSLVQEAFSQMEFKEDMYISLKNSIYLSKQGNYHYSYNAPCMILFYNKKSYGNSMADCACALENMTLQATELKIGSCYINQINWLTDNEIIRDFLRDYALEEDEDVYCALSLGYPLDDEFFEKTRTVKENKVYRF